MGGEKSVTPDYPGMLQAAAKAVMDTFDKTTPAKQFERFLPAFYGAFDNNAPILEPIVKADGSVFAYESLSCLVDYYGNRHRTLGLANTFYDAGIHDYFDLCTDIPGLKIAKELNCLPITINVSVAALLNPDFCKELDQQIHVLGLEPTDVIIEVLEHDIDPNADITHLDNFEYDIALDDFGLGQDHFNRLHVFGDKVKFIKIDGPYILGYLEEELGFKLDDKGSRKSGLKDVLESINAHYKNQGKETPPLLAERVHDFDEIRELEKLGFTLFQGRELANLIPVNAPQEPLANPAFTCDYTSVS